MLLIILILISIIYKINEENLEVDFVNNSKLDIVRRNLIIVRQKPTAFA